MLGELPQDILGSNPQYAPIVNHGWLTPDVQAYDNYPSDNNPVRIQPKLADLWGQGTNTGINLIPNLTVQPSCVRATEEAVDTAEIVREAKKAMMVGLKGRALADHLRARFASKQIVAAKDALAKLAEEQGLLGNVYIDASAFSSGKEAEQFMLQHRSRLAQDIVINESKISSDVVSVLASKFHKNVVASVNYTADLLAKYKNHLVAAGKISRDAIIDSKEALRAAFLMEPVKQAPTKIANAPKPLSADQVQADLSLRASKSDDFNRMAAEEMAFRNVSPILEFAREQFAKGKEGSDLKEMLRKKYATEDLRQSAKYLPMVIKADGLAPEAIDGLVSAGEMPTLIGDVLKKLGKKYPIKAAMFAATPKSEKTVGIAGYMYAMTGTKKVEAMDESRKLAVEALRKGSTPEQVKDILLATLTEPQADEVLSDAVRGFNMMPAGVKANVAVKAPKEKVVPDLVEKNTLPDEGTVLPQNKEMLSFFYDGASSDIDVGLPNQTSTLEVSDLFNRSGMDTTL
jgi:hypothetical protein